MSRFSSSAAILAFLAEIAGISALGAFLNLAPSQTASLPGQASVNAPAVSEAPVVADSRNEPRRAVRVVSVALSPTGDRL
jgi:hypothetical protein